MDLTYDLWRCDDGFDIKYQTIAIRRGLKIKPIKFFVPGCDENITHVGLIMLSGDFHLIGDYFIVL